MSRTVGKMPKTLRKWWAAVRAWLVYHLADDWTPIYELVILHERCCGRAAHRLVQSADWQSAAFNTFLTEAYTWAEKDGCTLYGWQRRTMVYLHAMKCIDFACGHEIRKTVNPRGKLSKND